MTGVGHLRTVPSPSWSLLSPMQLSPQGSLCPPLIGSQRGQGLPPDHTASWFIAVPLVTQDRAGNGVSGASLLTLVPCRQPRQGTQGVPVPIQSKPITWGGGRGKRRTFPQSPQRGLVRGWLEPLIPQCRGSEGAPPSPHSTSMGSHLGNRGSGRGVVSICCTALKTVPPLSVGAQEEPRFPKGASDGGPRGRKVPRPACLALPATARRRRPARGKGDARPAHAVLLPHGRPCWSTRHAPSPLFPEPAGVRRPLRRVPPVRPCCPRPRGARGLGLEGRSPRAAPGSSFGGVLPLRGCSRDSRFLQHPPPPRYRWGN